MAQRATPRREFGCWGMLHAPIRWGRAASAAGAVAAVLALWAAPGAKAITKVFWGPAQVNGQSQLPIYQDLGVNYLQLQLRWDRIAPTRPANPSDPNDPAYKWPKTLDQDIANAEAVGIHYALMLMGAPSWANGGHDDPFFAPLSADDYAAFATAASKRYPTVDHWMVWGEPNGLASFEPSIPQRRGAKRLTPAQAQAPRHYAEVLDAAYGAFKAVNPGNVVIGGMTYNLGLAINSFNWVRYMKLPNGKPPRLDLWGHNPFSYREPGLHRPPSPDGQVDFSDMQRFAKYIDHYRHGRVKFWLSEFTIPTQAPDVAFGTFAEPPAVAAKWIRSAFKVAHAFRRITTMAWYSLYDEPPSTSGAPMRSEGLLFADGTPKPGYYAFKAG